MNKICGHCRQYTPRPYNEDICAKTGKVVGYLWQKECFNPKEQSNMNEEKKEATKVCSVCGRELPLSAFGRHARTKDGLQTMCHKCKSKAHMNKRYVNKTEDGTPEVSLDRKAVKMVIGSVEDQELADELRRRGYEVKATKTITVEL